MAYCYSLCGFEIKSNVPFLGCDNMKCDVPQMHSIQLVWQNNEYLWEEQEGIGYIGSNDTHSLNCYYCGSNSYLLSCFIKEVIIKLDICSNSIYVFSPEQLLPLALLIVKSAGLSLYAFHVGLFPFHASAVVAPEGLCAFAAESGVGKTTLLYEMLACGYSFFTDDILMVQVGREFLALPMVNGCPKVCFDNLVRNPQPWMDLSFAYSFQNLECYVGGIRKYTAPIPLTHLFILAPGKTCAINFTELKENAAEELAKNVHIIWALLPIQRARLLHKMRGICSELQVYKVSYPRQYEILPKLVSILTSI